MQEEGELRDLIEAIWMAQDEYEDLAFDEFSPRALGPPLSEASIDRLEARLGAPLPDDYRAFLRLHNGWRSFHADGHLLSFEEQDSEWVRDRIRRWSDIWDSEDPDPFLRGALPIMLGENLHHFVVLDPTVRAPDGAAAIVEYDYMEESARYDSFKDLLCEELKVLRELIDQEVNGVLEDDDAPGA